MFRPDTADGNDAGVFYVEQSSGERSLPAPIALMVPNSTNLSGIRTRERITISSIASPEPKIVTIELDSNEPTMPYVFGRQLLKIPPSLNFLKPATQSVQQHGCNGGGTANSAAV